MFVGAVNVSKDKLFIFIYYQFEWLQMGDNGGLKKTILIAI